MASSSLNPWLSFAAHYHYHPEKVATKDVRVGQLKARLPFLVIHSKSRIQFRDLRSLVSGSLDPWLSYPASVYYYRETRLQLGRPCGSAEGALHSPQSSISSFKNFDSTI
jgi:hypothetical protein